MNFFDLITSTIIDDSSKNPKQNFPVGYFLELVLGYLPSVSRQSLNCVNKFFHEIISPEVGDRFSFELSVFSPSIMDPTKSMFEYADDFCGTIISYNKASKKTTLLASPSDFNNMQAKVNLQVVGRSSRCKGGIAFRVSGWTGGEMFFERIFFLPKKQLKDMIFYFAERLDDLKSKEEPLIKKAKHELKDKREEQVSPTVLKK